MYVLADHRRTGIATALLAAFADRAAQADCSFIKLQVDESDGNSTGRRALFTAVGFTPCGRNPALNMGAAVNLVRTRTRHQGNPQSR